VKAHECGTLYMFTPETVGLIAEAAVPGGNDRAGPHGVATDIFSESALITTIIHDTVRRQSGRD
jgi:hypothetical protein